MATLAPSLRTLLREVDARWPKRSRAVDGWYRRWYPGARPSDHHPDGKGMVHAVDITSATILPYSLASLLARMSMPTLYVIWDRRIYSRHRGFAGIPYTGPHPHTNHIHCSIIRASWAESWAGSWGVSAPKHPSPPPKEGFGPAESFEHGYLIEQSARLLPILATGTRYWSGVIGRMRT